jgi:cytochrome P450
MIRGVPLPYVKNLHLLYGEVVRISPDELSFDDSQAWRDIHGNGSGGEGSPPPKKFGWYHGTSVDGVSPLLAMPDEDAHKELRKKFRPAFTGRALLEQAPLFTRYADQLVESLKKCGEEGANYDMVRGYNFATFNIMGDFTFGEPLHMVDNAEYDSWVRTIFQNIKRGVLLGLLYNYYPLAAVIFRALWHKTVAKLQHEHFQYTTTRVTKRVEKGRVSGVDLWDLAGMEGLTREEREEMNVNASVFMIAGTETTATLLSGLTYLLLTHSQSMDKLKEEVRSTFASSDGITMKVLADLPYLNACIKEALRMYPPVPIGLPHLTPSEGSTICGHYVPPNVRRPVPPFGHLYLT